MQQQPECNLLDLAKSHVYHCQRWHDARDEAKRLRSKRNALAANLPNMPEGRDRHRRKEDIAELTGQIKALGAETQHHGEMARRSMLAFYAGDNTHPATEAFYVQAVDDAPRIWVGWYLPVQFAADEYGIARKGDTMDAKPTIYIRGLATDLEAVVIARSLNRLYAQRCEREAA